MSAVDFVICGGLTAAGLVLSYFRWRRKGPRSGFRLAAWSLLPLAAYLTGTVTLIRQISTAIVHFGGSFVFSTKTWAGVVLAGLSVVVVLTSGGIPLTGRRQPVRSRPSLLAAALARLRSGRDHPASRRRASAGPGRPTTTWRMSRRF